MGKSIRFRKLHTNGLEPGKYGTDNGDYCTQSSCTGVRCEECLFWDKKREDFDDWLDGKAHRKPYPVDVDSVVEYFKTLPDPLPSIRQPYEVLAVQITRQRLLRIDIKLCINGATGKWMDTYCTYQFPPKRAEQFEIDHLVDSIASFFQAKADSAISLGE